MRVCTCVCRVRVCLQMRVRVRVVSQKRVWKHVTEITLPQAPARFSFVVRKSCALIKFHYKCLCAPISHHRRTHHVLGNRCCLDRMYSKFSLLSAHRADTDSAPASSMMGITKSSGTLCFLKNAMVIYSFLFSSGGYDLLRRVHHT